MNNNIVFLYNKLNYFLDIFFSAKYIFIIVKKKLLLFLIFYKTKI